MGFLQYIWDSEPLHREIADAVSPLARFLSKHFPRRHSRLTVLQPGQEPTRFVDAVPSRVGSRRSA